MKKLHLTPVKALVAGALLAAIVAGVAIAAGPGLRPDESRALGRDHPQHDRLAGGGTPHRAVRVVRPHRPGIGAAVRQGQPRHRGRVRKPGDREGGVRQRGRLLRRPGALDQPRSASRSSDTGENTTYGGGTANLPNITLEIDPNLNAVPNNYTSMVWNPAPLNSADLDQWSPYLDATTTGGWYFTNGAVAGATGCSQATMCTFTQLKAALNDGGTAPTNRHARGREGPRQHVDRCGRRPAAQRQGLRLRG